jgi:hypothetical protein
MIAGTSVLCPARTLFGGLEQRAHVDVVAEVGKRRGHDLGAAVVAVLAQLGDHHARPAALRFGEGVDLALERVPALGTVVGGGVHPGHLLGVGAVAPPRFFQRIAHLPHRGAQAHRLDRQVEQIAFACFRASGQCRQRRQHFGAVTRGAQLLQTRNLVVTHRVVVDVARFDGVFFR